MPDSSIVDAWIALVQSQKVAVARVEARLKAAGLPALTWYDALWELEKAGEAGLRPFELERALLFEQYNLSRLVDRLEKAGLVDRAPCPDDGRGQMLKISDAGRVLRARMWQTYSSAIDEAVGARLSNDEADRLATLLKKLT